MNITITRKQSTPSGTPGNLTVVNPAGDTFTCETLELPWQDNTPGISCIINDSYSAAIWHSDHLDCDVLRLEDKHGRQDCLIHCGNFAGDVSQGMETQVHGCTLVGSRYGSLANDDGSAQMAILNSRVTLAQLIEFVGTGEHNVDYHWAQGCEPTARQS
ncbi:DUF5675 family protein [Undibacterium sp. RuRC25W]|uniref:DUF5675 family protein n=1 Tax=Undibacterium sp. RuRC25W TaxID=3413047 RepID=UPI003BF38686